MLKATTKALILVCCPSKQELRLTETSESAYSHGIALGGDLRHEERVGVQRDSVGLQAGSIDSKESEKLDVL